MPLDFEGLKELLNEAQFSGFREIREDETVSEYRLALADFIEKDARHPDPIEAYEIRFGVGWDKWSNEELAQVVREHPDLLTKNPMVLKKVVESPEFLRLLR